MMNMLTIFIVRAFYIELQDLHSSTELACVGPIFEIVRVCLNLSNGLRVIQLSRGPPSVILLEGKLWLTRVTAMPYTAYRP